MGRAQEGFGGMGLVRMRRAEETLVGGPPGAGDEWGQCEG